MPILRLRKLECLKTGRGEVTEEPYLCIYVNKEKAGELGPFKMKTGDSRELYWGDFDLGGLVNHLGILLGEDDPYHTDDHLGGFEMLAGCLVDPVGVSISGTGSYYLDFPINRKSYDAHYRIYYDFFMEAGNSLPSNSYCLQLLSIHCINAQEWKDYVFIKVNGDKVWGPQRMRDRGDASIASLEHVDPIQISSNTEIRLWEKDSGNRNDLFGTFHLTITEDFNFDLPPAPIRFSKDKGISGDAIYEITYSVCQRIENPGDDVSLWRYRC